MTGWLAGKSLLGLARGVWLLIALLALAWAVWRIIAAEAADDSANREIGATVQREEDLRATLDRTEKANETRQAAEGEAARGGGAVLYRECLSANRGAAEVCQRFLPQ